MDNIIRLLKIISVWLLSTVMAYGASPLWTLEPLTETVVSVPSNADAAIRYRVTNQSSRSHELTMLPIQGISQTATGSGICSNLFVLAPKQSCILSLTVNGSQLAGVVSGGPKICQKVNQNLCYQPSAADVLQITPAPPIQDTTISVNGSPLSLTANGATGSLTIHNNSLVEEAFNIVSDFSGTALEGNVTETGNTCDIVEPGANCTLTYTPGNTMVAQTNFTIQGTNTNALTAAIAIESGSTLTQVNPNSGTVLGGTSVTLTGTGLTGATGVTFGGVPASGVNVVNSTTVAAVTPAFPAAVPVFVSISAPAGGATLANGYTYVAAAVGQPSGGGVIGCLNGGLNDLIAAVSDISAGIVWGGSGTQTNAVSSTNGATNTTTIVNVLGNNGGTPYAAELCNDYEIDSQGNIPCQVGNVCYDDWFLPADDQLACLYTNRVAIGGFNAASYWSSTESLGGSTVFANTYDFVTGIGGIITPKTQLQPVRCVRAI